MYPMMKTIVGNLMNAIGSDINNGPVMRCLLLKIINLELMLNEVLSA